MWSATVLEPALPGRSATASISWVLSHQTARGWYPETTLERRCSLAPLTVRGDQGRVDIQDHDPAEVGVGDLGGRQLRQLSPHVTTHPGAGPLDPLQRRWRQLVQGPPHRGGRGDRPQHLPLVAQHVAVRDRLTTIGQQDRDVDQDPAPVMHRTKRGPGKGLGQLTGEARLVGQQPHRDAPSVGHHTRSTGRYGPPRRPCRMLHL
jgi:hypothetical protein